MGYPFVIAHDGDMFARINHDGEWSVDWNKTSTVRYSQPNDRNKAIIACAVALMAAKDNFPLKDWATSDAQANMWTHEAAERDGNNWFDLLPADPDDGETLIRIRADGEVFARVNFDGTWSILWDKVDELALKPMNNWKTLSLVGFARMLRAGKYNFPTTEWDQPDTDEDED